MGSIASVQEEDITHFSQAVGLQLAPANVLMIVQNRILLQSFKRCATCRRRQALGGIQDLAQDLVKVHDGAPGTRYRLMKIMEFCLKQVHVA